MNVIVVGINHKTAPIEIREKFFLTHLEQDLFLSELKSHATIAEGLVLSTCNRTEMYLHAIPSPNYIEPLIKLIASIKKVEFNSESKKYFYSYVGEEAIRHLLRVWSG